MSKFDVNKLWMIELKKQWAELEVEIKELKISWQKRMKN